MSLIKDDGIIKYIIQTWRYMVIAENGEKVLHGVNDNHSAVNKQQCSNNVGYTNYDSWAKIII